MATELERLLARLANRNMAPLPEPAAPMSLGPLSEDTALAFGALNPEPVPPAILPPTLPDRALIDLIAGARPTAPAPLSRGQRIANALIGFGAGVQGRGGEFLAQLQEPQREYQRQLERYEGRRAQGVELAERRAEREAERANRAAELQYNRDYNMWLKKMDIRRDEADTRTKQAFDLLKIREAERIADEKLRAQQRAQQERDARLIARDYGKMTDNPKIALELGRYYAGLTDKLSPEAAKFESVQNKLAEARALRLARIAAGGGRGGTERTEVELVDAAGNPLGRMPYSQVKFGQYGQVQGFPRGTQVRFVQPQGQPQPAPQLPVNLFPEFSGGLLPSAGTAPAPTEQDVRGYAKKFKMSLERARKELMGR